MNTFIQQQNSSPLKSVILVEEFKSTPPPNANSFENGRTVLQSLLNAIFLGYA